METNEVLKTLTDVGTRFGLQILGAILVWVIGRSLIRVATRLVTHGLEARHVDATIARYLVSALTVAFNLVLVVAILGFFGVETTSFAALLAAAGVAIGMAWSGLLSNFAAGSFLIVFRPFKVGDFVTAGGVTGTVKEMGLFATAIDTPDNVLTIVGNNKIFSDTIQNFSANPYRRIDCLAQLAHGVDCEAAGRRIMDKLVKIPNALASPPPEVEILEFNLAGPRLAVRPYCQNQHYWQVYFATNRAIRAALSEAGYPVPEQHYAVRSQP